MNDDRSKSAAQNATEWRISPDPVPYTEAMAALSERVDALLAGTAPGLVWLLEHPPIYTAGASATSDELLDSKRFPVFHTGRGGRYTYHGPGQRVVYVCRDLRPVERDMRTFIARLESLIARVLLDFGVTAVKREGRNGLWVIQGGREACIAAIGLRVKRLIAFHGFSLNVDPDLSHYAGIVPCGLRGSGVTSLRELGLQTKMADVDEAIRRNWPPVFEA